MGAGHACRVAGQVHPNPFLLVASLSILNASRLRGDPRERAARHQALTRLIAEIGPVWTNQTKMLRIGACWAE